MRTELGCNHTSQVPPGQTPQLHQSSLQDKIQLHRAPGKTTCPLPAAPVTPGQARPLPGSPSPTLGDALRCPLPTHERAVFSRSVLLLHKKKETNSTRQEFPGPSASPAGRKEPTAATQKPKPRGKSNPSHGDALQSTKGFLLLCQINLAPTQSCLHTASTTHRFIKPLLGPSHRHLRPIHGLKTSLVLSN